MKNEYTVISSDAVNELVLAVNEHLKDGWKCQGGITYSPPGLFYQAMIREVKDTKAAKFDSF